MKVYSKNNIRHFRIMKILSDNGLTVKQLAERAGINYQTVSKFVQMYTIKFDSKEKSKKLFNALKELDDSLVWEDIFNKDYEEIAYLSRYYESDCFDCSDYLEYERNRLLLNYENDVSISKKRHKDIINPLIECIKYNDYLYKIKEGNYPTIPTLKSFKAFILYYVEDFTLGEIANKFGISRESARQLKNRGARKVHRILADDYGNDNNSRLSYDNDIRWEIYSLESGYKRIRVISLNKMLKEAIKSGDASLSPMLGDGHLKLVQLD